MPTPTHAASSIKGPTTSTSRCSSCRCATTATVVGVITLSKLGLGQFDAEDLRLLVDPRGPGRDRARVGPAACPYPGPRRRAPPAARHERRAVGEPRPAPGREPHGAPPRAAHGRRRVRDQLLGPAAPGASSRSATTRRPARDDGAVTSTSRAIPETHARPRAPGAGRSSTSTTRAPTRPRWSCWRATGNRVLAMLPLVAKGQSIGLVELFSRTPITWDDERLAARPDDGQRGRDGPRERAALRGRAQPRRPRPADRLLQPPVPARAARRGGRPRPARRGGR